MKPWDHHIAAAGEKIVEYLLDRIDPDEIRYPSHRSTASLRIDLEETLDGAIGDWLLRKMGGSKP